MKSGGDRHGSADVTVLLDRVAAGDRQSTDRLLEAVYGQLRRIAQQRQIGTIGQLRQPLQQTSNMRTNTRMMNHPCIKKNLTIHKHTISQTPPKLSHTS